MNSKLDRAQAIDENFIARVSHHDFPYLPESHLLIDTCADKATYLALLRAQLMSRLLDLEARRLKQDNLSYYTIGSSGHEGNVALGFYARGTDMAFLHYRSAAFVIARSFNFHGINIVDDLLRSFVASAQDPIAGGRHKVFGSKQMFIPPQTSTIASHLPKAVATAFSIRRARELGIKGNCPDGSVVICSFGDASINHASALSAFNAASWIVRNQCPLPLVMVCEDNGRGISVPTPRDWVECRFRNSAFHYIQADGLNLSDCIIKSREALQYARVKQKPVLLHLRTIRLMGHAGSDVEFQYRTEQDILREEAQDPILTSVRLGIEAGYITNTQALQLYQDIRTDIVNTSERIIQEPKLSDAKAVMQSIIPPCSGLTCPSLVTGELREKTFGAAFKTMAAPKNMNTCINFALTDLMLQYPNIVLFGEDVGAKGGVYRVSADLQKRFGARRVFDTLLDEQTILGHAIGLAHNGFLPIPEIQFLAYYFNAEDQIRGEAATLSFFSCGQYTNPMVIRVAGLAYQKGFGGHFHNDNSLAPLRDLPGVIVACPSRGADAAKLLRECVRLAYEENRVVFFIEPIALYMTKDLLKSGDNEWLSDYPDTHETISFGEVTCHGGPSAITILTYGNGCYLSRAAQAILSSAHQIDVQVIDIHWLSPLPLTAIIQAVQGASHLLIVDECRRSGSLSEALFTLLHENMPNVPKIRRLNAEDSFIPLGPAWEHILPSRDKIVEMVLSMVQEPLSC